MSISLVGLIPSLIYLSLYLFLPLSLSTFHLAPKITNTCMFQLSIPHCDWQVVARPIHITHVFQCRFQRHEPLTAYVAMCWPHIRGNLGRMGRIITIQTLINIHTRRWVGWLLMRRTLINTSSPSTVALPSILASTWLLVHRQQWNQDLDAYTGNQQGTVGIWNMGRYQ